jgi:hypothetical protein
VLHVNSQLLPDARTDGQLPRPPFAGAVTVHPFGTHICVALKVPFVHVVSAPTRLKPVLHVSEQLLPEGRFEGQLPRKPFAGGVTGHEFAACALTEIDRLNSAAASRQIIADFIVVFLFASGLLSLSAP